MPPDCARSRSPCDAPVLARTPRVGQTLVESLAVQGVKELVAPGDAAVGQVCDAVRTEEESPIGESLAPLVDPLLRLLQDRPDRRGRELSATATLAVSSRRRISDGSRST